MKNKYTERQKTITDTHVNTNIIKQTNIQKEMKLMPNTHTHTHTHNTHTHTHT